MKKREVTNRLYECLNPFFKKYGFNLYKRNNRYIKKNDIGSQIIDFLIYKRSGFFEIEPVIRIKIDSIEEIYRSVSKIEDRPYCTLGNHLSDILRYTNQGIEKGVRDIPTSNWMVAKEEDIDKLKQVIPEYFEEAILPYFENNTSIARVDELLNKFPSELSIHNYLYPLRANISIIAAKLNQNPKYDELLSIYEKELEDAEETYKEEFVELKKKLSTIEKEKITFL